ALATTTATRAATGAATIRSWPATAVETSKSRATSTRIGERTRTAAWLVKTHMKRAVDGDASRLQVRRRGTGGESTAIIPPALSSPRRHGTRRLPRRVGTAGRTSESGVPVAPDHGVHDVVVPSLGGGHEAAQRALVAEPELLEHAAHRDVAGRGRCLHALGAFPSEEP